VVEVVQGQQQQQHEVVVEVVHQTTEVVEAEPYEVQVPVEVLPTKGLRKHYKTHISGFFLCQLNIREVCQIQFTIVSDF